MKKCCGINLTKKAYELADQGKDLQKKVTEDLVPAVSEQLSDKVESVRDRLQDATSEAASAVTASKKSHKGLLITLLVLALSGLGYLLWRRSQPVEDPWAEEYWEDVDVEEFTPEAEEKAEAVADKAGEAAEKVEDKAKDAAQKVAAKSDSLVEDLKQAVDKAQQSSKK